MARRFESFFYFRFRGIAKRSIHSGNCERCEKALTLQSKHIRPSVSNACVNYCNISNWLPANRRADDSVE